MASGWERESAADSADPGPAESEQTEIITLAAGRRERVRAAFPMDRLILPAGRLKVRSNDTDYRFRPHSAFSYLTGLGRDQEPDAVLVLDSSPEATERAVLYYRPGATVDSEEFYTDSRYGALWIGARPTLAQISAETGLPARHLDEFHPWLQQLDTEALRRTRIVPDADPELRDQLERRQERHGLDPLLSRAANRELAQVLAEVRLVKDLWEIGQIEFACEVTAAGFADIVRALPQAQRAERGERVVESAFEGRARVHGNGIGYDTIAASGAHACTLHWITNDGPVRSGDLLLVDAGAEVDSLYTADITRTLPVNGTFSPAQRMVYQAVLDAADAVFEIVRPGAVFHELSAAAMRVIAQRLHDWGLLPGSVEECLAPAGQFHRRWMVHGTSHHLGLDVHDCARARDELYLDGRLEPGMVFTIEPGLYFRPDDLLVPAELRGIGVRIEDDVLVTADGWRNLSAALPRTVPEVESWMAGLLNHSPSESPSSVGS
jgi:Xaa-Pro aminopeptidase